ncbi:MAG: hypothetical protein JWO36_820 [Myxococcales bacterium]|nr:hypothetical protein [Myxococcales bacterium]
MRTWLWFSLALASCSSAKDEPKPTPPSQVSAALAPAPATVEIFVDDKSVNHVTLAQLAAWPRVDTLVPVAARRLGTWELVTFKGKSPKPAELAHPSATYPELVPALFPAEDNTPSYGMFDPVELAKHGKPVVREDGIREVRIKVAQGAGRGEHESGEGGGADPTTLKISIKTAAGEKIVDGKMLLAVARQPMPGETGEGRGWPLTAILELGGVTKFQRLLLTDSSGMNLTLDKADFDPKHSVPFIKLNRQGQLRFRVFKKQGDTWQPGGDLRGLVGVQVLK